MKDRLTYALLILFVAAAAMVIGHFWPLLGNVISWIFILIFLLLMAIYLIIDHSWRNILFCLILLALSALFHFI